MKDLVSTIIPVHNREALLVEAAESAIAQTYRPIEVIIVDDGSTDDTPRVARDLATAHEEVRVVRRDNGGPGAARETGRLAARGEFLQYLDSDDLLLPRKFELQVRALRDAPDCGVAYGHTRFLDASGHEIEFTWKPLMAGETTILPSFLRARMWETATPLYRATVTAKAGPWTNMRLEEDWEYDCRVGALGTRLAFVDAVVVEHRDLASHRLSRGEALDPRRLRDRARAHELMFGHARTAGIADGDPDMQRFARELFLLARQCGAAGLPHEARRLLRLAAQVSGARDIRFYTTVASMIGHRAAGTIAIWHDHVLR